MPQKVVLEHRMTYFTIGLYAMHYHRLSKVHGA